MNGIEYFSLLVEQKRKLCAAFTIEIRSIFKLFRYTSIREVIAYMGSKPCDILLDERCFYYCYPFWKVFVFQLG